ncbi:MAG: diaminopimelate epimerase [Candidatus Omnitrophota bacterium]
MTIPFVKAEGTGNDFVIIDARDLPVVTDLNSAAKKICNRKKSIGADGLLIYDKSSTCDFKMRIFNSDGSEAEMCGNGIRCIAQYAKKIKSLSKNSFDIETKAGRVKIDYLKTDMPRLKLTPPENLKLNLNLDIDGKKIIVNYVVVGVPHVVYLKELEAPHPADALIDEESLEKINVAELGRKIRFHKEFAPAGTNVNFIEVTSSDSLKVRTYERGVEEETLACGSGSSASSLIAFLLGKVKSPITVTTSGGEFLTVYVEGTREKIEGLYLEAPANIVFEGKINI